MIFMCFFVFFSLPTDPTSQSSSPEQQQINLVWPNYIKKKSGLFSEIKGAVPPDPAVIKRFSRIDPLRLRHYDYVSQY